MLSEDKVEINVFLLVITWQLLISSQMTASDEFSDEFSAEALQVMALA